MTGPGLCTFGKNVPEVMRCSSHGILSDGTRCRSVPFLVMYVHLDHWIKMVIEETASHRPSVGERKAQDVSRTQSKDVFKE